MSIEEKANAYDEALKRAKEICNADDSTAIRKERLADIFPELRESEDERIRKGLIDFVNHYRHNTDLTSEQAEWCKKALAWLEKQKEEEGYEAIPVESTLEYKLGFKAGKESEKQKEQPKEELVYCLNGLMQDYIKEGKDDEEKEHRLKCYRLFWDALEDADFFEQKEQKPELIVGKYLISTSNFGDSYILGIPCKIMSEPYLVEKKYHDKCIKVMSCITGIEYEIPYAPEWFEIYDSFEKVLGTDQVNCLLRQGLSISRNPLLSTVGVVGKKYYPMDNFYAKSFTGGDRLWVANKVVTIISKPYTERIPYGDKIQFVIVKTEDGEVGKCLFMEWKLVP